MKLHEFQAKDIFRNAGIPVPEGKVVTSGDQALDAARGLTLPVPIRVSAPSSVSSTDA